MDKTVTNLNHEDELPLPTVGMALAFASGGMNSSGAMWLSGFTSYGVPKFI